LIKTIYARFAKFYTSRRAVIAALAALFGGVQLDKIKGECGGKDGGTENFD
jgi:hypothetical protein